MTGLRTAIIFDLGDVILPFDPLKPCSILGERIGKSAHEVAHLICGTNLERRFTQGQIDGDLFTKGVSQVLGLDLNTDDFQDLWSDMFTENKEVSEIVRQLKPRHDLVLLSNTNPWHWRRALEQFPIVSEFQDYVLSYEVGVLKPHPAIYRAALEKAGSSQRVIFIDDIELNVDGARMMGIRGVHFRSADQLRRDLLNFGCRL